MKLWTSISLLLSFIALALVAGTDPPSNSTTVPTTASSTSAVKGTTTPASPPNNTSTTSNTTTASMTTTAKPSATNASGSTNESSSAAPSSAPTNQSVTNSTDTTTGPPATPGATSTSANTTVNTNGSSPNTTTVGSTVQPLNTTTPSPGNVSTTLSTTPSNANTTRTSVPTASSSTTLPTTHPTQPPASSLFISETNLLLANDSFFVEIKGERNMSLKSWVLVIIDASSGDVAKQFLLSDQILDNVTGLFSQPVTKETVKDLTSYVVGLYRSDQIKKDPKMTELQDFVVSSFGSANILAKVSEALLLHKAPTIIVKPGLTSEKLSVSRCQEGGQGNEAFVVVPETAGQANSCNLNMSHTPLSLQLHSLKSVCHPSKDQTNQTKDTLLNLLVGQIGNICHCGLSPLVIQARSNLTCAQDLYLEFFVSESYSGQMDEIMKAYKVYVGSKAGISLNDKQYSVVNCTSDCQRTGHYHPHPQSSAKDGNITTTVAVVLSCIAVFLVVLAAVILYMRKKRHGVMRQFRMTRLQEDDDMDDMDNFIGGIDHEPSFSIARNNRS